jgi:CheY-like chemotaxis protein
MKKRILIVDGQLLNAVLTMRALDDCDVKHAIHVAGDGYEAKQLLRDYHFDMLILDIEMPRVGGFELLRWMKHNVPRHLPVIVVSNSQLPSDLSTALNLGAIEFVHRSFEFSEYSSEIQAALKRHGFC